MKPPRESFNITNELYKRSRKPCNKITTCIRKFAEKKTAESKSVNKPVQIGNVKSTFIIAFSSDDTLMASTHGDHNVRVTDIRTQECIMTLIGHPRTPWCVTFHPSSNQILASGCLGGEVRVWDLHGGSEVWVSEHHNTISSLSFHPLDQVLAIATSNQIYLWNWSQPKPFASVKTACLAEKVRLIRFSTHGDFLLTGIANLPRDERDDLSDQRKLMFNSTVNSNSDGSFQRPALRRFFQFTPDRAEDFESHPHSSRHGTETQYMQSAEYRVRRASARRDRMHMAEVAMTRASNQSREIHNLLSRSDANSDVRSNNQALDRRALLSQARDYAASVTLETVANRATDALVSGEAHRAAGRDAMSHRQILDSVLSNMQNESQPPPANSRFRDLNMLTQRRTNSVLRAAIQQRPRQRLNAWRSPDTRPGSSESRTPTALELRSILHPELSLPSTSDTNRDSVNNSSTAMQTSDTSSEASGSGTAPQTGSERAGTSSSSLVEHPQSSTTRTLPTTSQSADSPGCSYGPSTSREHNPTQRPPPSSSQPLSSQNQCPHHDSMLRRNIKQKYEMLRDRVRERTMAEARHLDQDSPRPNEPVGLSTVRRIARRVQTPGPLTRCWSSRRKCSHFRGRLVAISDDTPREVRRSRVGVHRLSRGMERVRQPQQPLHRHYDVSIFDEEVGRPSRNVHAVVNRAIADAFHVRGETAVANNIKSTTHRLQWWDFSKQELPDISDVNSSVIVPHCKIHNDNSCDLSQDSQLLATFVPSPYGFPDNGVLAIYSLKQHNFGDVLYTKSFGPNAICTSLSPLGNYVIVGLAARRLHCWHQMSRRVMAQVFRIDQPYAGESSLVQVNSILHDGDVDQRHQVSVNVVKWIPCPGAGIAYGTNKGDLRICVAGHPTVGEYPSQLMWNDGSTGTGDMYSRYSIDPAQRARLYNDISLMALGIQFPNGRGNRADPQLVRVARATQTGEDNNDEPMDTQMGTQSSSTQTEQPMREAVRQPLAIQAAQVGDNNADEEVGVSNEHPSLASRGQEVEQPNAREGGNNVAIVGEQEGQRTDADESRDHETGESV